MAPNDFVRGDIIVPLNNAYTAFISHYSGKLYATVRGPGKTEHIDELADPACFDRLRSFLMKWKSRIH